MREEHEIVRLVRAAQTDGEAADEFIRRYMPFVKSETAKLINRIPVEGRDDELGVALLAFYEAMMSYRPERGAFLKLAATAIRNRIIDYHRRERKHYGAASLDAPDMLEDGASLMDRTDTGRDEITELDERSAAKAEIEEYSRQLAQFGLTLSDVADSCPKQGRTLDACLKALEYAKSVPELLDELTKGGRLPLNRLAEGSGVERKTLERHRKYMVAIMLAYTNGFEIIRGHLRQMERKEVRQA